MSFKASGNMSFKASGKFCDGTTYNAELPSFDDVSPHKLLTKNNVTKQAVDENSSVVEPDDQIASSVVGPDDQIANSVVQPAGKTAGSVAAGMVGHPTVPSPYNEDIPSRSWITSHSNM